MGFIGGLAQRFTHTGRRLARRERSFQRAQAQAQLADVQSEIGFRQLEDPREQAQLRGSLFGRGLGKSSIATQNTARLTDIQARRMAALQRRQDLAARGIDLIKLRAKAARRLMPFDIIDDLTGAAASGASLGLFGGAKAAAGAGTGSFYEWSPTE